MMLIFNNELKNIMRLKERDLTINDLTEFMNKNFDREFGWNRIRNIEVSNM